MNPGIVFSGFLEVSKYNQLKDLPSEVLPNMILISPHDPFATILQKLTEQELSFPVIAKPNSG